MCDCCKHKCSKCDKELKIYRGNHDAKREKMKTIQTQLAFFFKNPYKGNFEIISLAIKDKFGETQNITQIPNVGNIPNDLQRLMINYANFKFTVSKSRIDLFILEDTKLDDLIEKFNEFDFAKFDIEIIRIGFIQTFFVFVKNNKGIIRLNLGFSKKLMKKRMKNSEEKIIHIILFITKEKLSFGVIQGEVIMKELK